MLDSDEDPRYNSHDSEFFAFRLDYDSIIFSIVNFLIFY